MTKPAVVLIGGDKGGVGKTTVARTLLDYVRAFDTEVPRGTLKRFHPDVTDVVDINHVPDQMRIFDTVNSTDAAVSLIDVRAGLLSPTLRALRNIGFIEAAKKATSPLSSSTSSGLPLPHLMRSWTPQPISVMGNISW